jgi:hypothetical protein
MHDSAPFLDIKASPAGRNPALSNSPTPPRRTTFSSDQQSTACVPSHYCSRSRPSPSPPLLLVSVYTDLRDLLDSDPLFQFAPLANANSVGALVPSKKRQPSVSSAGALVPLRKHRPSANSDGALVPSRSRPLSVNLGGAPARSRARQPSASLGGAPAP